MLDSSLSQAYTTLMDKLPVLEEDNPLAKSHVAKFAAFSVSNGLMKLADLEPALTGGTYYPLFLLCLQQLTKLKDQDWLVAVFNESKINLVNMLPGKYTYLQDFSLLSSIRDGHFFFGGPQFF